MNIKTFGVIGAGQMGGGIAQVAAASGLDVIMSDISEECTAAGLATIEKNLVRSVEKGKLETDEANAILSRLKTTINLGDMAEADYVVEAAVEMEDLKFNIFRASALRWCVNWADSLSERNIFSPIIFLILDKGIISESSSIVLLPSTKSLEVTLSPFLNSSLL